MLILLFYFICCICAFWGLGLFLTEIFKVKKVNPFWVIWTGLLGHLFLAHTFVFWIPLNIFYALGISTISFVLLFFFRKKVKSQIHEVCNAWLKTNNLTRCFFLIYVAFVISLCAHPPFLIDNESYYIATIQWVSEFGLVKGLGNFHIFLAQTSGWHLMQAAFGFKFFGETTNDLNGIVILLFCGHLILFSPFQKTLSKFICSVSVLLMIPFVSSPSPDLILFLLTPLFIFGFINSSNLWERNLMAMLGISLFLIKPTVFFVILFFLWTARSKKEFRMLLLFSIGIFVLWMTKNAILSGWLLYPLPWISIPVDWKLPEVFFDFQNTTTNLKSEDAFSFLKNFSKTGFIVHSVYFLFCVLMTFYFYLNDNKIYLKLMLLVIFQWLVVIGMGGNLRFLLPCLIILIVLSFFIFQPKTRNFTWDFLRLLKSNLMPKITFVMVTPWFIWLFFAPLKFYTNHKIAYHEWVSFDTKYLFFPAPPSRFSNLAFEKVTLGNLQFNSPISTEAFPRFLYGTYQGTIPTVHEKQLIYFEKRFKVVPQLRTNQLSDGFKSIPSKNVPE